MAARDTLSSENEAFALARAPTDAEIQHRLARNLRPLPDGPLTYKYDTALRTPRAIFDHTSAELWTGPSHYKRSWTAGCSDSAPTGAGRSARAPGARPEGILWLASWRAERLERKRQMHHAHRRAAPRSGDRGQPVVDVGDVQVPSRTLPIIASKGSSMNLFFATVFGSRPGSPPLSQSSQHFRTV
jgi:hypothetical protein